jgi:hypothetical protein
MACPGRESASIDAQQTARSQANTLLNEQLRFHSRYHFASVPM